MNFNIYFDNGGNVYLKYNDKFYDININNDNKILLEYINLDVSNLNKNNITFGKLKLVCDASSLKGKIQKEIIKNEGLEELDEIDTYLYENKEFTEYYDNLSDNENNFDEKVKFIGNSDDINFLDYNNSLALYDTLLYDIDNIYFKTLFINIQPCYRLKIYKNGYIYFRPLGEIEQIYKLTIVDNELLLIE